MQNVTMVTEYLAQSFEFCAMILSRPSEGARQQEDKINKKQCIL
jgi:hypothetical protein